jgi:hypothetical protein
MLEQVDINLGGAVMGHVPVGEDLVDQRVA